MKAPKKISIDLPEPVRAALEKTIAALTEKQGSATISDAVRHSILKAARGGR